MTSPSSVRDFYDDLAAEYDAIFADWDASVRHQAGVLEPLLGDAPDPVLDVAAGMGTQAIGLALRGHRVDARDLSPGLVERGRREAARLGAAVDFAVADMRDPGPRGYGAVIAVDNALPHLATDADLRAALRSAHGSLRPGGRFLASIRDYDALRVSRPTFDPPRLFGAPPARRAVFQIWTWAPDGASYDFDHVILREEPAGWTAHTRRTRYRALLRAELDAAAVAEGFADPTWRMPEASGFYQPIFLALRR